MDIFRGLQTEFTANLLRMERPLICRREYFEKDIPAADEQQQGTSGPKIEYRTAKAAFPTSYPEEQKRRFFVNIKSI